MIEKHSRVLEPKANNIVSPYINALMIALYIYVIVFTKSTKMREWRMSTTH